MVSQPSSITTCDEVRALQEIDVHVALGMAIDAGRLDLERLARMARPAPSSAA
jgi:hypothetical protein